MHAALSLPKQEKDKTKQGLSNQHIMFPYGPWFTGLKHY